MDLNHL